MNEKKESKLITVLIALLGVTMPFGEQMNIYFPLASLLYTIIGILLFVTAFTIDVIKNGLRVRIGTKMSIAYWITIVLLSILLFINLQRIPDALGEQGIINYFKQPIFMIIGYSVYVVFRKNIKLVYNFICCFVLGFVIAVPFGQYGEFDGSTRFLGVYSNPNTYAIDCCIMVFFALYLAENKKHVVMKYALALLGFVMLLVTGTRGALLGCVLGLVIYVLKTKRVNTRVMLFAVLPLVCILLLVYLEASGNGILSRFISGSVGSAADLRTGIWFAYIKNISMYFWTGMQERDFGLIYRKSPHNTVLGMFVRYGIFVFLPYLIYTVGLLIKSFKRVHSKKENKSNKVIWCLFIVVFIAGFFTENFFAKGPYVLLGIVLAIDSLRQDELKAARKARAEIDLNCSNEETVVSTTRGEWHENN